MQKAVRCERFAIKFNCSKSILNILKRYLTNYGIKKMVIIVKLIGGLGNQMFQYAIGKSIALHHNAELKLDLKFFNTNHRDKSITKRNFQLCVFNINGPFATDKEVFKLTRRTPVYWLDKILNRIMGCRPTYFIEKHYGFDNTISAKHPPVVLEGFWQSEKYFVQFKQEILRTFKFSSLLNSTSVAFLEKIKSVNAVSIHVRRSDYVTVAKNTHTYGACSIEYYQEAVALIKRKVSNPVFFVFTDDYEWVRHNLIAQGNFILVEGNIGDNSWMDMCLMSNCKHNIIANSSFSWWGAWLNKNVDKMVIAPQNWYKNPDFDTKDIVPQGWIRL